LKFPAALSFSEWEVTSVASKSSVIRSGAAPFAHALSRAWRRASRSTPSRSGVIALMTRQAVGDDATWPNRSDCSRSTLRSARQSPPSAMVTMRSRTTRPGSWAERRRRVGASPADSAVVHPSLSASSVRAALPAWLAIPALSVVTMSVLRRLVGFIFKGLSFDGCWDVWQRQYPTQESPSSPAESPTSLLNGRG